MLSTSGARCMPPWLSMCLRWILTFFLVAFTIVVAWFAFGDPAQVAFDLGFGWWCKALAVARHPLYYYMVHRGHTDSSSHTASTVLLT